MAYIETIAPDQAAGPLKKIYDQAQRQAGRVFQILQVQSQNPSALRAGIALYTQLMHADSPLTRAQREMLAVVVSRANNCHY